MDVNNKNNTTARLAAPTHIVVIGERWQGEVDR
jgi:hypothetical protein